MNCPFCKQIMEECLGDDFTYYKIDEKSEFYSCKFKNCGQAWFHLYSNKTIDYVFKCENIITIQHMKYYKQKTQIIINEKILEVDKIEFDKDDLTNQINNLITKFQTLKIFI